MTKPDMLQYAIEALRHVVHEERERIVEAVEKLESEPEPLMKGDYLLGYEQGWIDAQETVLAAIERI